MEKVEVEFKFKVGDLVIQKEVLPVIESKENTITWRMFGKSSEDMRFVIVERWYQQCYNTTQIHYDCHAIFRNGGTYKTSSRFTEPEIVSAPPFRVKEKD